MNTDPKDIKLLQILRRSHPTEVVPNPVFKSSVWRRIERDQNTALTIWSAWLRARAWPVLASAVTCFMVAGWIGAQLGDEARHRHRTELLNRYLASIDPHRDARN